MENKFKVLGIIALIAVIGFSMAACGGDDDGGPSFDGTWVMSSNNSLGYTFKGKTFIQFNNDAGWSNSGTFTYTDTTITFSYENGQQYSIYYTLTDTYLQLTRISPTDNWWTGRYDKK